MKTTIYFDGACHLCSREMDHYRKIDTEHLLDFVDIADPAFSALAHGLDPIRVNKEIHVRDSEGKIHVGVQSFIVIWQNFPKYNRIAKIAANGFVKPFLDVAYVIFANLRPYLPKRKGCYSGTCAIDRKN